MMVVGSVNGNDICTLCPACYSKRIKDKWPTYRNPGRKTILWCADCGFGWQHPLPIPSEIRDYYNNYTPYNIHGANEKEESSIKRIGRINKLMPKRGRLLDVGSGLGYFLKVAQNDGWEVVGLEPQKSAALHCQNILKINVHNGSVQDLKNESESFDVVTLWDVWEHVHEPLVFLEQCINLVAPGGLLAMAVPNASGWPARMFKDQWRYVMKTHLNYFTLPYTHRIIADRSMLIERIDHTIKIQSLLQGFTAWLPFTIDTERLIRLGRKDSTEQGRPEQKKTDSSLDQSPVLKEIFGLVRRIALKINLMPLPGPYGDLMDLYCRKSLQ
jgi:2-polyprenyl-3-methyl-5-hydroxy-6-metoxy-1,4-benzoquinol methylase